MLLEFSATLTSEEKMGEKLVAAEKKDNEEVEIITAVYKLNLHCKECVYVIRKYLGRSPGVHKVDIEVDTGKITVIGEFDPIKMHEKIEKKTKKKVEWIAPNPSKKEEIKIEENHNKKQEVIRTVVVKVQMHCANCENDLKWKILKLNGVQSVRMNRGAGTCTIVGTMEEDELIEHIRDKLHKHGEIIKVEKENEEEKVEKVKIGEEKNFKKERVEVDLVKKRNEEEIKTGYHNQHYSNNNPYNHSNVVFVPYFIYCNHAPQWFSDENPNSCSVL